MEHQVIQPVINDSPAIEPVTGQNRLAVTTTLPVVRGTPTQSWLVDTPDWISNQQWFITDPATQDEYLEFWYRAGYFNPPCFAFFYWAEALKA